MSEPVVARPGPVMAMARRGGQTAGAMGRVMFADPIRHGRLRLDGLPPVSRQLSVFGVVGLAALLVSLLLNDLWRRGPLTLVQTLDRAPAFAAVGIIPFTLVAIALAWVLLIAGAALGRPVVAVLVGVAFLLCNAGISTVHVVGGDSATLRVLPVVISWSYFAAPTILVLGAMLRCTSWWRPLRAVFGVCLVMSVVGLFGGQLWVYAAEQARDIPTSLPQTFDAAMTNLQGLLLPLIVMSVGALVQLNYQAAEAIATPFRRLPKRAAKVLLAALIGVKLRFGLAGRISEWGTYLSQRRVQALQAVGFLVFLAGAAWLFRQVRKQSEARAASAEALLYTGALLLASTIVVVTLVTNIGIFFIVRGRSHLAGQITRNLPLAWLGSYQLLIVFSAVIVGGAVIFVRPRAHPWDRGLGAVLLLLGVWVAPNVLLQQVLQRDVGFRIDLVDILLTGVAAGYVAVRWRHLDTAAAVRIGALLVFASLVAGNGYVATRTVSRVFAWFAPPAVLLTVVGVLYVVLADSSFASASSRRFPRETRVLLWIGYLIFTVAVTNYVLVAREPEFRIEFDRYAFYLLALPLAAWLAVRAPMMQEGRRPRSSVDEELL